MNKNKLQTTDEIGALIRNIRKEQHISQEELAGLAGTGVRFISELENGKATDPAGICSSLQHPS